MNIKKNTWLFYDGALILSANGVKAQVPSLPYNNVVQMPQFGLGTYGIPNNDIAKFKLND